MTCRSNFSINWLARPMEHYIFSKKVRENIHNSTFAMRNGRENICRQQNVILPGYLRKRTIIRKF